VKRNKPYPQRFVDICEAITLADPAVWQRTGVIPLTAGASSQPDFAKALKTRFRQVVPHAIVVDEFLNPSQLSQLLQNAILNIHPSSQPDFAKALKTRFRQVVPYAIVVDEFLNPSQLLQLLQNVILNIHPARYEAFGMTIVEAASCGVPTVLSCAGIGTARDTEPGRRSGNSSGHGRYHHSCKSSNRADVESRYSNAYEPQGIPCRNKLD
jgi:folate-dependent phosphoribosylglycinamide formyltransferase PurN